MMSSNIKLDNPQQVIEAISGVQKILEKHNESMGKLKNGIAMVGNLVQETIQTVNENKRQLISEYEQTKMEDTIKDKQQQIQRQQELKNEINQCEQNILVLNMAMEEVISLAQECDVLTKKSAEMWGSNRVLSQKVERYIEKIVTAY